MPGLDPSQILDPMSNDCRLSVRARLGYREATHVRMQSERNNLTVCTRACFFSIRSDRYFKKYSED
ncbi:hypothetical protein J6590_066977 [Homalodisca vitripennis]|nr:hypothetical protein J6590_066977 [Homalodisca vitripennis]